MYIPDLAVVIIFFSEASIRKTLARVLHSAQLSIGPFGGMAFLNKARSLIQQTLTKHINHEISVSKPSILQAVRWMSQSKLFVGGISYQSDESSLREAFSKYGDVIEARIITDRDTGRSRGFGFITFSSSEEASAAIQALDGQDLHGRRIRVNYANDRVRGGGGYGGGYGGQGGYGGGGYGSQGGYGQSGFGGQGGFGGQSGFGDGGGSSYGGQGGYGENYNQNYGGGSGGNLSYGGGSGQDFGVDGGGGGGGYGGSGSQGYGYGDNNNQVEKNESNNFGGGGGDDSFNNDEDNLSQGDDYMDKRA